MGPDPTDTFGKTTNPRTSPNRSHPTPRDTKRRIVNARSPGVSEVGVGGIGDAGAYDDAREGDGQAGLHGAVDDVREKVDGPLDVRLLAEPREVTPDEHVEVLACRAS